MDATACLATTPRPWQRLNPVERRAVALCPIAIAALLLALVQACEVSIQRGELHRAEQRQAQAQRVALPARAVH